MDIEGERRSDLVYFFLFLFNEVCSIGTVFLGVVKLRGYGECRFMIAMFVFFQNQERSY